MRASTIRHRSLAPGFALIEVMIAVIVLATGLLALTALQGALVRSSADSKARSLIVAYGTSELDRLRLGGTDAIPSTDTLCVAPCGATPAPDGDPLKLAAAAGALSELSRTITSTQFVYDPVDAQFEENAAAPGDNAYFKQVTLNLTWSDATGSSRRLSMGTVVSPLALNSSKILVDRTPPDDAGLRPVVRRPTPVTEGMIPIATGGTDGENTAATNPKPKLLGGENGSYVSDTRYDVLTYSSDPYTPANFAKFNKRIETAVVGCVCRNNTNGFTGNGAGSGFLDFLAAQGYRPTYWDGSNYKEPAIATSTVNSSPAGVSQSALCDVCCRDHKDPGGVTGPRFSPWPGQDAAHYTAALTVAGADAEYIEACRVIRVNGVFRVAADAKIQDTALVTTRVAPPAAVAGSPHPTVSDNNSATSPLLAPAGQTGYTGYVYQYLRQVFHDQVSAGTISYSADPKAIQASNNLNEPSYVPIRASSDTRWLHARALLTDYLEPEAIARIVEAKSASTCAGDGSNQALAQCVLPFTPVATINTTEIASWSKRAYADADASTLPPLLAAPMDTDYLNFARAFINRFNSGLALFDAISTSDASSPADDEQLFVQLSAAPPSATPWLDVPSPNPTSARYFGDPTNPMRGYARAGAPIVFNLSWSFPTGNPTSPVTDSNKGNDPAASVTNSAACTPGQANNSSNPYSCLATGANGTVVSLAGYNRVEYDTNFNNPCGSGKVTKPSCVVYTFNGASVNAPAGSVPANGATLVSGTAGHIDEIIQFTVPTLNTGTASTVTIDFTRSTPATTNTCSGNTPVWTVPCQ